MTGVTTYMFAVEGIAANAYLAYLAYKFKQKPNNGRAQKVRQFVFRGGLEP